MNINFLKQQYKNSVILQILVLSIWNLQVQFEYKRYSEKLWPIVCLSISTWCKKKLKINLILFLKSNFICLNKFYWKKESCNSTWILWIFVTFKSTIKRESVEKCDQCLSHHPSGQHHITDTHTDRGHRERIVNGPSASPLLKD